MPVAKQVGAECTSKEDGCLYRVRVDRVICQVVEGVEVETIDSLPLRLPAGAHVLTGVGWGFRMPIGMFYQQIIGRQERSQPVEQLERKIENIDSGL